MNANTSACFDLVVVTDNYNKNNMVITKCLLCTVLYLKYFICINSFNSQKHIR